MRLPRVMAAEGLQQLFLEERLGTKYRQGQEQEGAGKGRGRGQASMGLQRRGGECKGRAGASRAGLGRAGQADLWPEKECVQKPPSMSHTLADLSALAVASKPPLPSTAIWSTGAR